MKNLIIKSSQNYSDVYFSEDLKVVNKYEIKNSRCSKIIITGEVSFEVLLYISDDSLIKICDNLFGIISKELKDDLLKEIVNIIAGNIQTNLNKNLTLSTPKLCESKNIINAIYFENSILNMAISIKKI